MTDNEIIKALEWCEQFENNIVFKGSGDERCVQALQRMVVIKHALKEYNRQKAEIERLRKANESFSCMGKMYSEIKSEARKEFAERAVKRICETVTAPLPTEEHIVAKCIETIDNLLAEMEERE